MEISTRESTKRVCISGGAKRYQPKSPIISMPIETVTTLVHKIYVSRNELDDSEKTANKLHEFLLSLFLKRELKGLEIVITEEV